MGGFNGQKILLDVQAMPSSLPYNSISSRDPRLTGGLLQQVQPIEHFDLNHEDLPPPDSLPTDSLSEQPDAADAALKPRKSMRWGPDVDMRPSHPAETLKTAPPPQFAAPPAPDVASSGRRHAERSSRGDTSSTQKQGDSVTREQAAENASLHEGQPKAGRAPQQRLSSPPTDPRLAYVPDIKGVQLVAKSAVSLEKLVPTAFEQPVAAVVEQPLASHIVPAGAVNNAVTEDPSVGLRARELEESNMRMAQRKQHLSIASRTWFYVDPEVDRSCRLTPIQSDVLIARMLSCSLCASNDVIRLHTLQGKTQGPCTIEQFRRWTARMKNDPTLMKEYNEFQCVNVWTVCNCTPHPSDSCLPAHLHLPLLCQWHHLLVRSQH